MGSGPNDVRGSSGGDDPLPEDGVRRDVRVSRRDDLGVEVTRDFTSQGRLARGSSTNMSRLSFRVGAVPRQERDPELEALRDPEPSTPPAVVPEASVEPAAAAAVKASDSPPEARPASGGLTRMLGKLFGRGSGA